MARVLLLIPTTSYKTRSFLEAAERLGAQVVVGCERRAALEAEAPGRTLTLDFSNPERAVRTIVESASGAPFDGIIGTDDESVQTAALASFALGLRNNSPESVARSRDKHAMRLALRGAGWRAPWFRLLKISDGPDAVAAELEYPCVVKPLSLSASRGVIRADDPQSFVAAFRRSALIVSESDLARRRAGEHLLVEGYLSGSEVALEGILDRGALRMLALFDKPDTPDGPTFEETLLVTPSRLEAAEQRAVIAEVQGACVALELTEGPVHAELRMHAGVPVVLEVAARTIGGLCSRMLRFATGRSLEEVVLRHILGVQAGDAPASSGATGVFMIPVPHAGRFGGVRGVEQARALPGIGEITLTVAEGTDLLPLPEGHRYVGFVFASGETAAEVEATLGQARARLEVVLD